MDKYLSQHLPDTIELNMFLLSEEFQTIIKFLLLNWKAAVPNEIYNFIIKKLEPVH